MHRLHGYTAPVRNLPTALGTALARPRRRAILAAAIALAAPAAHMTLFAGSGLYFLPAGLIPGLAALVGLALLARGDRRSLGLVLTPARGWLHWARLTVLIGLVVALFSAAVWIAFHLAGSDLHLAPIPPAFFWQYVRVACIDAPLVEESVYRLALCTGLVPLAGPRIAIAASGIVFAALHVLYGNAGPDNVIAGFVLAWAYLRSGTLLVPIALHSLGNLCVGLAGLAFY